MRKEYLICLGLAYPLKTKEKQKSKKLTKNLERANIQRNPGQAVRDQLYEVHLRNRRPLKVLFFARSKPPFRNI